MKLNEVKGKEQYQIKISNRFAALGNLDSDVDINRAWETNRENIRTSAKEIITNRSSISRGLMMFKTIRSRK
jgi:hypothetical protein